MKYEKYQRALLIDDDKVVNYVQEIIIRSFNIINEIVARDTVESALAYLKASIVSNNGLPDIIFLDISMPVMDGFDFLTAFDVMLKEHNYHWQKEACKIIVLSSSINSDDIDRAYSNLYIYSYLNKPLSKEDLDAIGI